MNDYSTFHRGPTRSQLRRTRSAHKRQRTIDPESRLNYHAKKQRRDLSIATIDRIKSVGQSTAILVAIVLLIFMVVATWQASTMINGLGLAIFTMTLVSVLLFLFSYLTASYMSNKSFVFLVLVLLAIALIKVFLVLTYQIGPTSDYFNYHYLAYARASGIPWTPKLIGVNSSWPHVLNIAFLYSIPYSLIGTNYITSQLINILLTFFDALLIYKLSASIINKQAGIFSALIFSTIPAYFMYTLLNGAEPMFLTFVLALFVSFDSFLKQGENSTVANWIINVVLMFIWAVLAYMVRPTIMIWLIAGLLFIIFRRFKKPLDGRLRFKRLTYFLSFFAAFFIFTAVSSSVYSLIYGVDVGSTNTMNKYSLATGTSPKTNGSYNDKIYQLMDKNYDKYHDNSELDKHIAPELDQQIQQNVDYLNDHHHWGMFIDQKYRGFAAEDYGYNWLLYNTHKHNPHAKAFYSMQKPLTALSVIFFEFILIISIITMSFISLFAPVLPDSIELQNKLFYFALLLDGFILGSMIFEVQGRYHAILYIPLVMILGLGVKLLTERKHKIHLQLNI